MTPNAPAVTVENALVTLEEMKTPESQAILDYVAQVKAKNIAVLGVDEAFVLTDGEGQIKAFKSVLNLSQREGTLIQPVPGGPFVVSAQGYEVWAESTGTSVIFPKEVLVGTEWKPNPYAERDPENRRILAVHARAVAFKYSRMGIPQVSDWTTIFDTPSYRMIDLLAKAKKTPQAFKLLPKETQPEITDHETWASYPFDESTNLWVNTNHQEVIGWYATILNREKKAMDFAQTFAKRNALKHLSGLQKSPNGNQWAITVLAWRPTGNNIVKWDATQYSDLQDRVDGMLSGKTSEFDIQTMKQIEVKRGAERASDDEDFEALEAATDPEDQPEVIETKAKPIPEKEPEQAPPRELSRDVKQAISLSKQFPGEFEKAMKATGVNVSPLEDLTDEDAAVLCTKTGAILDAQNA